MNVHTEYRAETFFSIIYCTVTSWEDVQMIHVFNIFPHILWEMDVLKCPTQSSKCTLNSSLINIRCEMWSADLSKQLYCASNTVWFKILEIIQSTQLLFILKVIFVFIIITRLKPKMSSAYEKITKRMVVKMFCPLYLQQFYIFLTDNDPIRLNIKREVVKMF